jgi:hypothetical protein
MMNDLMHVLSILSFEVVYFFSVSNVLNEKLCREKHVLMSFDLMMSVFLILFFSFSFCWEMNLSAIFRPDPDKEPLIEKTQKLKKTQEEVG